MNSRKFWVHGTDKQVKNVIEKAQVYCQWSTSLRQSIKAKDNEDILWLRDDVLYNIDFKHLILQLQQGEENVVVVNGDNNPVMFYRKNKQQTIATESVFPVFTDDMTTEAYCRVMLNAFSWKHFKVNSDEANIIDTVSSFHCLSMRVLKGELKHIVLDHHQVGKKLVKGLHTNLNPFSQKQRYAYVGDSVYVHTDSVLYDNVILCKNSYIDQNADITSSIILPNVYIGPYLKIFNAVVTKNSVIRVDTGNVIPIIDEKMIAEM
jgi:hypothetical protein